MFPKLQTALNADAFSRLRKHYRRGDASPRWETRGWSPVLTTEWGLSLCQYTETASGSIVILRGREEEAWKKTIYEYCERTFSSHYSLVCFQTSISSTSVSRNGYF